MQTTSLLRTGACMLALLGALPALAADEYSALLKDKKFAEVDKLAGARLAREPGNADAMVARATAIMNLDDARIEEAIAQAEKCVATHPNNGRCHLSLGQTMGTKAVNAGIMKSLGSAGTIRESLKKAVALNPADIDARFTMLDFYMMAPFMVGGGTSKAQALARESASISPELSKLMLARVEVNEGNLAQAESMALAAKPGADEELRDRHEGLLVTLGAHYLREKKFGDGERVLREAMKRYPESESPPYMLARVMQSQDKHREALALFEQALGKAQLPYIHYRMAKTLQALGEKARAAAAFDKALAAKAGLPPTMRSDALEQLKAVRG